MQTFSFLNKMHARRQTVLYGVGLRIFLGQLFCRTAWHSNETYFRKNLRQVHRLKYRSLTVLHWAAILSPVDLGALLFPGTAHGECGLAFWFRVGPALHSNLEQLSTGWIGCRTANLVFWNQEQKDYAHLPKKKNIDLLIKKRNAHLWYMDKHKKKGKHLLKIHNMLFSQTLKGNWTLLWIISSDYNNYPFLSISWTHVIVHKVQISWRNVQHNEKGSWPVYSTTQTLTQNAESTVERALEKITSHAPSLSRDT